MLPCPSTLRYRYINLACPDFADGFPFFNEMASEGALIRPQCGRAPEGAAARLGAAAAFLV